MALDDTVLLTLSRMRRPADGDLGRLFRGGGGVCSRAGLSADCANAEGDPVHRVRVCAPSLNAASQLP